MTHRDTTMLERICWTILETIDAAGVARAIDGDLSRCEIDAGLFDMRVVTRAILNELKQVDEGMVEAGRKKYFEPNHTNGLNGLIAGIFTSAIDQVLSQGE